MNFKEQELAKKIVSYSLKIKENDRVLITYQSEKCKNFIREIIKEISRVGAISFLSFYKY